MEDTSSSSFVNREDAIPVIRIPPKATGGLLDPSTPRAATPSNAKDKLADQAHKIKEKLDEFGTPQGRQSLQDRFLNGILSQIIPPEDVATSDTEDVSTTTAQQAKKAIKDRRSSKYVERPAFSIPMMSSNFRRFNARIGVVFVLQNRLIHLFTWRHPMATICFLGIYSIVCLRPHLLPVLPLAGLLFWIMIPSFLARHPVPTNDPRVEPSFHGPPLAPPSRVKPAPEMSKDFFRNMRDLQNCMEDFSRMHDAANEYVTPYTNFSDEGVSSMLFVSVFVLACVALLASEVMSWRLTALVVGWVAVLSGHPEAQKVLLSSQSVSQLQQHLETARIHLRSIIEADIILDEPADTRQVEIFELQKYHPYSDTWEAWIFSPSPYDPLSPARIAGDRARGTQFFEEVQPPGGWVWKDKKWSLDLESREWVEQRMITGVEIETEGERWVYDIPPEKVDLLESKLGKKVKKGGKAATAKQVPKSGWEEGDDFGKRGEWRRRRWVRLVRRRVVTAGAR